MKREDLAKTFDMDKLDHSLKGIAIQANVAMGSILIPMVAESITNNKTIYMDFSKPPEEISNEFFKSLIEYCTEHLAKAITEQSMKGVNYVQSLHSDGI